MKKNKLGQSMFELLVAVFVIAITLTALVSLVTTTIGNTTFSRERTQSAKFTQEAVEWLRAERDNDWGVFYGRANASGIEYCLQSLSWTASCAAIANTNLTRTVELTSIAVDIVRADVVTSWTDANGLHESRVTTNFTNWRTR